MRETQSPKKVRPTGRGHQQYVITTSRSARLSRECRAHNPRDPRSIYFTGQLARRFGEAC